MQNPCSLWYLTSLIYIIGSEGVHSNPLRREGLSQDKKYRYIGVVDRVLEIFKEFGGLGVWSI